MADKPYLLTLPGEIRNRIYRLVLLEEDRILVDTAGIPEPAMLIASKQLRNEGI